MALTYKHGLYQLLFSLLIYFGLCASNAYAQDNTHNDNELDVIPKRCVALRQGQICYQEVTFKWQQLEVGNYCLVELPAKQILKCWQQARQGEFYFDFQSSKSKNFALRKSESEGKEHEQEQGAQQQNLSETHITVSWVFKSSKRPKSSWKLL